jgi:hypothetical protein
MEYQVPQFIEVEDKIFGPFTLKQFIYLAGGAGVCAIAFFYLPLIFAIIVGIPIAAFAGALAFYRVNNKPFEEILEAGFTYFTGGRLYLWKKEPKSAKEEEALARAAMPRVEPNTRPKLGLTSGKLHDLAWSLDIKNQGTTEE